MERGRHSRYVGPMGNTKSRRALWLHRIGYATTAIVALEVVTLLAFAVPKWMEARRFRVGKAVVVEGVATVDGSGTIDVWDVHSKRIIGVYHDAPNMPAEITQFVRSHTYADKCWTRVYDLRVAGTVVGPRLVNARSVVITRKYSDADLPTAIGKMNVDPLNAKGVCPSN